VDLKKKYWDNEVDEKNVKEALKKVPT